MSEIGIILSVIAPTVPMWEVWYSPSDDSLFTEPVLALALTEPKEEDSNDPAVDRCVYPLSLQDGSYIDYPGDRLSKWAPNLLGYSFEPNPKKEDWKHEISVFLKYEAEDGK